MSEYKCERCKAEEALPKQKYCKACKKKVLAEMTEEGYLQKTIPHWAGRIRTSEQKELTYQTKHGTGH